jgi:hypothetical protein
LNATEKAELTDLEKKRDAIKRRIRNLDSTWTKAVNAEIFSTGHLSGLNPLTKTALQESLDKVAESMSKDVVAFLEDKFDNLPAKANGEDGSEQFVMTNAVYLTALCQLIPLDISKIGEEIKRLYALLNAINKDTLTQDAFDAYKPSIDFIVSGLNKVEKMSVPDYLTNTQPDVLIEQIRPVCATIKFALSRAVYTTYTDAEQRNLPRWNEIKGWLDRSKTFEKLYKNGKEMFSFRDSDTYKNTTKIYEKLRDAIKSAAEQIWKKWCSVKSSQKAFPGAVDTRNDPAKTQFIGLLRYTRKKNSNPNDYATVRLWARYDMKVNSISVIRIKVFGTKFEQNLQNVTVPNWINKAHKERRKDGENKNGYDVYPTPAIPIEDFKQLIADSILSELHIDADGSIPTQIKEELITPSSAGMDSIKNASTFGDIDESGAAQYRALDSPEQKFHNIIDMGNPLKDIRSRRRL